MYLKYMQQNEQFSNSFLLNLEIGYLLKEPVIMVGQALPQGDNLEIKFNYRNQADDKIASGLEKFLSFH